ncbi:MAG: alkaline phosphatase family protein [Actinomycetota bacterium]
MKRPALVLSDRRSIVSLVALFVLSIVGLSIVPNAADAAAPTISSFTPTSGAAGTTVVVTGRGFLGATDVRFDGTSASTFTVKSGSRLTARVPEGAATGAISVETPSGILRSRTDFVVTPIEHVVLILQENHSFDDVLGKLCAEATSGTVDRAPCDGATSGTLSDGSSIPLSEAPDVVPDIAHSVESQKEAIDGGAMDGFDLVRGCRATDDPAYGCLIQFRPSQIPNLAALATRFAVSDRTFEFRSTPSWVGHMIVASATHDGFQGDNPRRSTFTTKHGVGWGCDSFKDARWWNGSQFVLVPGCIPDQAGQGPYRESPVPYVPTIFDRLEAAGLPWRIYGGPGFGGTQPAQGYGWSICPTFYECLGSAQHNNFVPAQNVISDAQGGTLPSYSVVTPVGEDSQHNKWSMAAGDNWIGDVVGAVENGPDWSSTAVFITYDDCGCFYDHVPPPQPFWGIRLPMVIVSPFAKPGYTDSNNANLLSPMAYLEHTFGLRPLKPGDASAYDYADAFDYAQQPVQAVAPVGTHIPRSERRFIEKHPPKADDPT